MHLSTARDGTSMSVVAVRRPSNICLEILELFEGLTLTSGPAGPPTELL